MTKLVLLQLKAAKYLCLKRQKNVENFIVRIAKIYVLFKSKVVIYLRLQKKERGRFLIEEVAKSKKIKNFFKHETFSL